jgi:hypothetical protein
MLVNGTSFACFSLTSSVPYSETQRLSIHRTTGRDSIAVTQQLARANKRKGHRLPASRDDFPMPKMLSKMKKRVNEDSWFARTMKLTRFERMTLWMSRVLESHALPLRHSS